MAAGSLTFSPAAGRSLEHSKGWAMGRQKKRRTRCWVFQGTHGGGGGRWVACVCFQVKRSGLAGQVGCPIRAQLAGLPATYSASISGVQS